MQHTRREQKGPYPYNLQRFTKNSANCSQNSLQNSPGAAAPGGGGTFQMFEKDVQTKQQTHSDLLFHQRHPKLPKAVS